MLKFISCIRNKIENTKQNHLDRKRSCSTDDCYPIPSTYSDDNSSKLIFKKDIRSKTDKICIDFSCPSPPKSSPSCVADMIWSRKSSCSSAVGHPEFADNLHSADVCWDARLSNRSEMLFQFETRTRSDSQNNLQSISIQDLGSQLSEDTQNAIGICDIYCVKVDFTILKKRRESMTPDCLYSLFEGFGDVLLCTIDDVGLVPSARGKILVTGAGFVYYRDPNQSCVAARLMNGAVIDNIRYVCSVVRRPRPFEDLEEEGDSVEDDRPEFGRHSLRSPSPPALSCGCEVGSGPCLACLCGGGGGEGGFSFSCSYWEGAAAITSASASGKSAVSLAGSEAETEDYPNSLQI